MLRITPIGDDDEAYRAPDLGWDGLIGDLIVNAPTHEVAPGDFRCEQGLATQVLILLMCDRRVEASQLRDGEENRGWIGDSFDRMDGEAELGSKLWLLRRRALYNGIEIDAQDYALEALQPLIDQSAVARVEAVATLNKPANRLDLAVSLYGATGESVYNQKFNLLWRQIDGVANPLSE
jgi:phage gp46-like protein